MFMLLRMPTAGLFIGAMAWSLSVAPSRAREPLTTFLPAKDMFQVPNVEGERGLGRNGSCLGIVESAITHWDSVREDSGCSSAARKSMQKIFKITQR